MPESEGIVWPKTPDSGGPAGGRPEARNASPPSEAKADVVILRGKAGDNSSFDWV